MRLTPFICFLATIAILNSCSTSQKSTTKDIPFSTTKSGIKYKIYKGKKSGKRKPKEGDFVEIHINTHMNDSLIFDSRKANSNKPASFPVKKPAYNGDLAEALMMMSAGDSAIFMVSVDSLKAAGQNIQPWMQSGERITYSIKMESVKTYDEVKKEQSRGTEEQSAIDDKLLKKYFADNKIVALKASNGLYYQVLQKGTGTNITPGRTVTVNYTGKTIDGNVFDSNTDPKFSHVQPFEFVVGRGNVIRGWDEGLTLFNKGTKAVLYIPSPMAYGKQSPAPAIPANSILIFDVEIVDFK